LGCTPKFWIGIIKFGLVLTIVQNFKPVGPRISEISRSEKKQKTSGLKHKPAPQAIAYGRTNNDIKANVYGVVITTQLEQEFANLFNKCSNDRQMPVRPFTQRSNLNI